MHSKGKTEYRKTNFEEVQQGNRRERNCKHRKDKNFSVKKHLSKIKGVKNTVRRKCKIIFQNVPLKKKHIKEAKYQESKDTQRQGREMKQSSEKKKLITTVTENTVKKHRRVQ